MVGAVVPFAHWTIASTGGQVSTVRTTRPPEQVLNSSFVGGGVTSVVPRRGHLSKLAAKDFPSGQLICPDGGMV